MSFTPCLPEHDPARDAKLQTFVEGHEQRGAMTGQAGLRLHYCIYRNPTKPLIMVAPGRIEAAFKYRELAMDLWHNGYEVVVLDHRGQGLSERMIPDANVGHMDRFEWAAEDLITLTRRCQRAHQSVLVLGHSMGASIALRVMELAPELYRAGAAIAPMLSLPLGVPRWLARPWVGMKASWAQWQWHRSKKIPGYISRSRQDYRDPGFADNVLTSSAVRYTAFRKLYHQQPELQLGGPTANWLSQAIRLMADIQKDASALTQPLLMIIAGDERVVTASGQQQLHQRLRQLGRPVSWLLLEQARHEILEECDAFRSTALEGILNHFQQAVAAPDWS